MVGFVYLISSVLVWILLMEMNSNQDAIWSFYVKDESDNDKLHLYDAIGIFALGVLLAYGFRGLSVESLLLGLFFFFARSGYFSWRMNAKRLPKRVKWNHLGDGWWDRMFQGNNTLYFITCFAGMIASLIWLFKEYV